MNITRVEVSNLYGYMNKIIDFNKDITLLVGINGSGKTSILNVVNWMLLPSFPNLCVTEFDKIILDITFKNEDYQIIGRQNNKEVSIDVKNKTKNYNYHKIQADLKIHPREITKNDELKEKFFSEYIGLRPDKSEEETWEFLFKIIPNPIVIGLDRNLYTEESNRLEYIDEDRRIIRRRISGKITNSTTPLEKVKELSSSQYLKYKNIILDQNKRLNDKIMLSSFEEILSQKNLQETLKSPKISLDQVESLEIKVKDYFEENIIERHGATKQKLERQKRSLQKIKNYFSNLKTILKQVKSIDEQQFNILYIINMNQFKKIKELIKEFEKFETNCKKAFEPINQYLESINLFLEDSTKELYFDKKASKLKFRILDKESKIVEDNREINTLSSGEKQILILFTYIKFNYKQGKLFIIDEPELSLHPKWQETFLAGIKSIMPEKIQLLFATHSPAIVGKNKEYCKILLPY